MTEQATEQASQPSVEARAAAALFGSPEVPKVKAPPEAPETQDPPAELAEGQQEATTEATPDAEAPAADGQPPSEETFEFEHEGTKWAIPKALEKAFQNNRDYTQKSQEVANQRRSYELLHEQARIGNMQRQFEQENGEALQKIMAYDAVLKQPIDWNSMDSNEAFRKKLQLDQWKDERDAIARTVDLSYRQWMQKQQDAINGLKAMAQEAVTKRIPGWNADVEKSVRAHAVNDGYTEAELSQIVDPRHFTTLWKAQQYDKLRATATKTVEAVKTIKTTPSNPMPQAVKDKLNFRKQLAKAATPQERSRLAEARLGALFAKK